MNQTDDKAFNDLDRDQLKQEIKTEAVKEAQQVMIDRIQGKKANFSWEERGENQPKDYNELKEELTKDRVKPEDIDARLDEKLKARDEAEVKKEEDGRKKQLESMEENKKKADQDWYDLVKQDKMPKIDQKLQDRINNKEELTPEEIEGDEGLKARLELMRTAQTHGKSVKLAYYENYGQSAGAKAPVLGARPSTSQAESKELKYEDVASNRKKIFGF